MRFFAVLLLVLLAGLGWALWQGIDLAADWLAEAEEPASDGLILDEMGLTAAEQDPGSPEAALDLEEAAAATPQPAPEAAGTISAPEPAQDPAAGVSAEADAMLGAAFEEPSTTSREAGLETAASGTAEAPVLNPGPELAAVATATVPDIRRITGDQVNLRQGPDVGTGSLGLLSLGDVVEVLEVRGEWLRVRTEEDDEGWVAARFLARSRG